MFAHLITDTGHTAQLAADRAVVVGCGEGVQLPVRAGFGVGPRHFELVPSGGSFQIRALSPEWPVWVNGVRVHVATLWDGDQITAGHLRLTFHLPACPSPAPARPPAQPLVSAPRPMEVPSAARVEAPAPVPHADWAAMAAPAMPRVSPARSGAGVGPVSRPGDVAGAAPASRRAARSVVATSYFNRAFVVACGGVLLTGAGCFFSAGFPWFAFLPAVFVLGLGMGLLVRWAGQGTESRFGHLAAASGVMGMLLAVVVASQTGVPRFGKSGAFVMEAPATSYARETAAADAAAASESPGPEHRSAATSVLFDPSGLDEADDALPSPDPASHASAAPAVAGPDHLEALVQSLAAPRTWLACLLMALAAWSTAFRRTEPPWYLRGEAPRKDTSHLTLRERVQLATDT
ncbi:MAG: hypothetical protein HS117_13845 [Verrucomicrobiaceae bacterium]|nr:hypothetical protein [Verrucomicrobiaceae bacterium]